MYISSAEATVYIYNGDNELAELDVQNFNFQVQEGKTPLYGPSSYFYSSYMGQNKIVRGAFSLNIKDAGTLRRIIRNNEVLPLAKRSGIRLVVRLKEDSSSYRQIEIDSVYFQSMSLQVDLSGQPLRENCEFLARSYSYNDFPKTGHI